MAILTSYTLVPELQTQFRTFVLSSEVNKDLVPPPTVIADQYMPDNSFIEMLFNDDYSESTYSYTYEAETDYTSIPAAVTKRLQIYPGSWQYVNIDSSGSNIFTLTSQDLVMLDALLSYRNGMTDSTSFLFIDSTATTFVADTTAHTVILSASYTFLTSKLAKLVYLYLRLQVLHDYSLYDNTSLISDGELLESCYEAYLLDKYYDYISSLTPDLLYDCQCD